MERLVVVLKPDAQDYEQDILYRIKKEGFIIQERIKVDLSWEQASTYLQLADCASTEKEDHIQHLISGPCTVLVVSGLNAVDHFKSVLGPADLKQAKQFFPKSLRALYAKNEVQNAVDASDSEQTAIHSLGLFSQIFSETFPSSDNSRQLLEASLYPLLTQGLTQLCKVKPSNPTAWLGKWLIENNPSQPLVHQ
ncbi:nucleoside diphosphate kinase 5-like protein [Chytridium lagenaria]|nr:nucleoside diphosphate kinase 5-like protein [Chytridium lagenaria]